RFRPAKKRFCGELPSHSRYQIPVRSVRHLNHTAELTKLPRSHHQPIERRSESGSYSILGNVYTSKSDGKCYDSVVAEKFTVGLIQMSCSLDPKENFAKGEGRIREAASRGAQIICTQELFRSQYFCREENADLFELAE